MLLINFICIFYSMVLVRCNTVSKRATDRYLNDDVTYPSNVIYARRDSTDPSLDSKSLSQRKPWLYKVPFIVKTAPIERVLNKLKQRNWQRITSCPNGITGMLFATESGYSTVIQNDFTIRPEIFDREIDDHTETLDTTTAFDVMDYVNNLIIRSKKKATIKKQKTQAVKEQKSEQLNNKFNLKDYFNYFKSHYPEKAAQGKKLLKQVKTGIKDKIDSIQSASVSTLETHKSKETNQKKHRHRRTNEQINDRRDPGTFDSRIYNTLTNKLYYKDFVDGFKHYLNFEREMANSNFSNAVLYEAHKLHNVDDIGKFILQKIPQVPVTAREQTARRSTDPDLLLKEFRHTTTTSSTKIPVYNFFKKRLIGFQRPPWLGKKSKRSCFSRKQSLRKRRSFDTIQTPHPHKINSSKLVDTAKNVAIAKVNVVETSKTKNPFKIFFHKFKKHKSKRDAHKAASHIFNKIKQIFSNSVSTTGKPKPKVLPVRLDAFPSHVYDILKHPMIRNPAISGHDDVLEKYEKWVPESSSTQFSYLHDYERGPKSSLMFVSKVPSNFNPDPHVPFELTTPPVADPGLLNKLHKLQKDHDLAVKAFEANYEDNSKMMDRITTKSLQRRYGSKGFVTAGVNEADLGSKASDNTAMEDLESYDEVQDLMRSNEQGILFTTGVNEPFKLYRIPAHYPFKILKFKNAGSGNTKQDLELNLEDKAILSSTYGAPGEKNYDNPADHYNIKPGMLSKFEVTELPKTITSEENVYNIKPKLKAEFDAGIAEFIKLKNNLTHMELHNAKWPKMAASNIAKLKKIPIINNVKLHKRGKTAINKRFGGKDKLKNIDFVTMHTSTMLVLKNKDSTEANDNDMYYNNYFDEEKPLSIDKKGKANMSNGAKHTQSIFERLVHNKVMDGPTPCKNANDEIIANARQPTGKLNQYEAQTYHGTKVVPQVKHKMIMKTRPPHVLYVPWDVGGIKYNMIKYSTTAPHNTKVTNAKSVKFDALFPEMVAAVTKNPLDEYKNSDSNKDNLPVRNELEEFAKSIGYIIKDWRQKQFHDTRTTTRTLKDGKLPCKSKIPDKKCKNSKIAKGKSIKNKKRPAGLKQKCKNCKGKIIVGNEKTVPKNNKCSNDKGLVTSEDAKTIKIEANVVDIRRLLKDWLSSTMKSITKGSKHGGTVRHMTDMTSDLSEDHDMFFPASTISPNKDPGISGFRKFSHDIVTIAQDLHKHYSTERIGTYQKDLFGLPKSESLENKGHNHLLNYLKKRKTPNFIPAANTGNSKNCEKIAKSDLNPAAKLEESEHESPENLNRIRDMIYAVGHGNIQPTTQTLYQVSDIIKDIGNVKTRNVRKSNLAHNLKRLKSNKLRRRKRLAEVSKREQQYQKSKKSKVCYNDTPDPEVTKNRITNIKRETVEKHKVKNVTALEVVMDLMKNTDEVQLTLEKPLLKNDDLTNTVLVKVDIPNNGDVKISLERLRKILSVKLSNPVDIEYEINSYYDSHSPLTLHSSYCNHNQETTTPSPPALTSGVYVLKKKYKNNLNSPNDNYVLEPVPNNTVLVLQPLLQYQTKFGNVPATETIRNTKLSKEFVSAVNEHLMQLYETYEKATKNNDTAPINQIKKSNTELNSANNCLADLHQKNAEFKVNKRETNKNSNMDQLRSKDLKNLPKDKDINTKHKRIWDWCPVCNEVIMALVFEMNSLVKYMQDHCTEVQTYFYNNPSGGRKLRDKVTKINKLMDKFTKKSLKNNYRCNISNPYRKINSKRGIAETVNIPKKYELSKLIDEIEHFASDISNATKLRLHFTDTMNNNSKNLVSVGDKCVLNVNKRNRTPKPLNITTTTAKDMYSINKKVNVMFNTENTDSPTTVTQKHHDNVIEPLKRKWNLKNFLLHNKKTNELTGELQKRDLDNIDSPLNADAGGSFWSNYIDKANQLSNLVNKSITAESKITLKNEEGFSHLNLTEHSISRDQVTQNINLKDKSNLKETLNSNRDNDRLYFTTDILNATTGTTESVLVLTLKIHLNDGYIGEKKERNIKTKHKEKHKKTKVTYTSKPMSIKDKNADIFDNTMVTDDNESWAHFPPQSNPEPQNFSYSLVKEKHKSTNITTRSPNTAIITYTNVSTTAKNRLNIVQHILYRINKLRNVKNRSNDISTVKYSNEDVKSTKRDTLPSYISHQPATKPLTTSNSSKLDDGSLKTLLLSILKFETRRIGKHKD